MSPDLIIFLVAGLAFVAIAGAGFAVFGASDGAATKRAREIATRSPNSSRGNGAAEAMDARRQKTQEMLKSLREVEDERRKSLIPQDMGARLAQAGLTISPVTFWLFSILLGGAMAGGIYFFGPTSLEEAPLGAMTRPAIAAAAGITGFLGIPRWLLGMKTKARHKKFTNQFADAIDIVVRGVKSGLPLIECLRIIAKESPDPLGAEFIQVADGIQMGQSIESTLLKLYQRVPLPEVNFFYIVLSIQAKAGGNLSEALNNLSTVIRTRKMLREKISALSSEAKASAMIIGVLPLAVMVLVYVTTPAYIMELFTDPMGHMILLAGAFLMGLGIFVMRKMINFDF